MGEKQTLFLLFATSKLCTLPLHSFFSLPVLLILLINFLSQNMLHYLVFEFGKIRKVFLPIKGSLLFESMVLLFPEHYLAFIEWKKLLPFIYHVSEG